MEKILLFVLIGLGAQLVDGTLGMAFGVTATTLFILSGTGAATASAVVHVVEVGTTFVSGISHWRFGNVDWGRVLRLGVPGAVGAFVGATFLSNLDGDAATPVTSSILLGLGLWVLVRFAFLGGGRVTAAKKWGVRKLAPLGLVGGLLDSTGGGGWGPVTTSTLMSAGEEQPRKIIGTVSAAEFLVAVAAVLGFLPMLRDEFAAHTLPIVGLLAGGIVAAPLAAFLVGRINPAGHRHRRRARVAEPAHPTFRRRPRRRPGRGHRGLGGAGRGDPRVGRSARRAALAPSPGGARGGA